MKLSLFFLFTFSILFTSAQPVITTFAPQSALPGATVIISGNNFSVNPTDNVVYFGEVKAMVNASTANTLNVTVPVSASFGRISVTVAGYTAYTSTNFSPAFPSGGIYNGSFHLAGMLDDNPGTSTLGIITADFDGDGKRDVCAIETSYRWINIYRNTTVNRNTSFAAPVSYSTGSNPNIPVVADIDGDGRQDIIVSNSGLASVSVFRNTSTVGTISFAAKVDITVGTAPGNVEIADLDKDGKPDMVTLNTQSLGSVSILKNNSTPGFISFAPKTDITLGNGTGKMKLADMDGDAKADIVVASGVLNTLMVLRNISTGTIAFNTAQSFATGGTRSEDLAVADMDGDGTTDVVVSNYGSGNISVFKSISSIGNINFNTPQQFICGASPDDIAIADLDGDGHPEVSVIRAFAAVVVLKNNSSASGIAFSSPVNYFAGSAFSNMCIGDVDGDNKPDIIAATGSRRGMVFINKSNEPQITSVSPNPAATGANVSITGFNFSGATQVSFGGMPAASFSVNNSSSITAVIGQGFSGDVNVETPTGTGIRPGFIYAGAPVITSFTPMSGGYGTEITITGNNFTSLNTVTMGGVAPLSITPVSPTTIKAVVGNGATGNIAVNTTYGTGVLTGFTYTPVPAVFSASPLSGGTGTAITITGRDFIGVTGVKFGGVSAASYTVVNSTTITAIVGNGASGNVQVTTNYGSGQVSGFTFIPAPVISSFTPTSAGPNMIVTIQGTGFTNANAVSFGGVPGYGINVLSSSTITAVVNTGASGNVTVTTPAGTASLAGFTFVPAPTITSFTVSTGTGGKVLIKGTNFSTTNSITLGGTAVASFTIVNSTTLEAIVANGSTGNLVVNTAGGTVTASGFTYTTLPVINTLIPSSGAVGTTVVIEGANFSTNAALNNVFFGNIRANVLSATANTITVTVPVGASSDKVSILTNNLTATSLKPFAVTFPGGGAFNVNSFASRTDFSTGNGPGSLAAGDLDGDGKNDVVVCNRTEGTISVFRNTTSTPASLTMAGGININAGINPNAVKMADIDVDGKLDIVLLNPSGSTVAKLSIFRNTSTTGNISFAPVIEIDAEFSPGSLAITDLNVDGLPDLAMTHFGYGYGNQEMITVYKNMSTPGNISFAQLQRFPVSPMSGSSMNWLTDILAADINNDYKPDLVVASQGYVLAIMVNQSFSGFISMGSSLLCSACAFTYSENPAVADFNGDGGYDIITNRNLFTHSNNFSFNGSSVQMQGMKSVGNLSGGIKPDLVRLSTTSAGSVILAHRNTSVSNISFESAVSYPTGSNPWEVIVADFNNDGKPDLATANMGSNNFSILLNGHGQPFPVTFGSLRAIMEERTVRLNWKVFTEVNVHHYEVERSSNGVEFFFNSKHAAQNAVSYTAYDISPLKGDNYYRIKAIDNDGRITYSNIVTLLWKNATGSFTIQSPLNNNILKVRMSDLRSARYTLSVSNSLGVILFTKNLGILSGHSDRTIEMPITLSSGIYFVTLRSKELQATQKLMVE